jgi:hypothetical protein
VRYRSPEFFLLLRLSHTNIHDVYIATFFLNIFSRISFSASENAGTLPEGNQPKLFTDTWQVCRNNILRDTLKITVQTVRTVQAA